MITAIGIEGQGAAIVDRVQALGDEAALVTLAAVGLGLAVWALDWLVRWGRDLADGTGRGGGGHSSSYNSDEPRHRS